LRSAEHVQKKTSDEISFDKSQIIEHKTYYYQNPRTELANTSSSIFPTHADAEKLKFPESKDESSAIKYAQPIENENSLVQSLPIKQSDPAGFVLLSQATTNTVNTKFSGKENGSTAIPNNQPEDSASNYSKYKPFGYGKKKEYNPDVEKYGVVHLHESEIINLETQECFKQDLPILTLSMAKILTISALSRDLYSVCTAINQIGYYMKQNWKAYKSHRKKQLELIRKRCST
jgi:hypothetical protein